jgi:hypothetical protein
MMVRVTVSSILYCHVKHYVVLRVRVLMLCCSGANVGRYSCMVHRLFACDGFECWTNMKRVCSMCVRTNGLSGMDSWREGLGVYINCLVLHWRSLLSFASPCVCVVLLCVIYHYGRNVSACSSHSRCICPSFYIKSQTQCTASVCHAPYCTLQWHDWQLYAPPTDTPQLCQ